MAWKGFMSCTCESNSELLKEVSVALEHDDKKLLVSHSPLNAKSGKYDNILNIINV